MSYPIFCTAETISIKLSLSKSAFRFFALSANLLPEADIESRFQLFLKHLILDFLILKKINLLTYIKNTKIEPRETKK